MYIVSLKLKIRKIFLWKLREPNSLVLSCIDNLETNTDDVSSVDICNIVSLFHANS